ncbi:MAG: exodeoxyribonuclease III [Acidimicrobiales bacterium]
MRLATWNVNSLKARMPLLERWLCDVQPDVVCLQETKCADDGFPFGELERLGYEAAHHGDGRWNGVAILSRVGLSQVERGFTPDPLGAAAECRLLSAVCGGVRVYSVYVPNGRVVGSEHYEAKLAFLSSLGTELDRLSPDGSDVVVAGDFNVAPSDLDLFDPACFEGATHVSPPERQLLQQLQNRGLTDTLRALYPETAGLFTWWDYRGGAFHKGRGMRIDLALASARLASSLEFVLIDRNARKGQGSKTQPQPSDHAPLVIQFRSCYSE